MTTKSRQSIYGASVHAATERAKEARQEADKLSLRRMEQVPARPSVALRSLRLLWVTRLNAGYLYLEVRRLGCDTHQTVALDVIRRPKTTPIHELERYMRCRDCSQVRGYALTW